jgi:antitoxin FitA
MCSARMYVLKMSRTIQIRNVPDSLYCTLKARAALAGMPLSAFLLAEIRALADRPTLGELRNRVRNRSRIAPRTSAADAVRSERDPRGPRRSAAHLR